MDIRDQETILTRETFRTLKITERLLPLETVTIEPGQTRVATAHPQWMFKPRRLIPSQLYPSLTLVDYKVGACCQTVAPGGIKMDTFAIDDRLTRAREQLNELQIKGLAGAEALFKVQEELAAIVNNFPSDTCQVGMVLSLTIENNGPEAVLFRACIKGTIVE